MHRRSKNGLRSLVAAGVAASVATGGLTRPDQSLGDDAAAAASPAAAQPAYWQVPPLPQAIIQGGTIPPGWQPQAVPYQGIGPDGQPLTMYFAPTYVFTYQSGPPVPAVPQVNRRRWWGGQPSPTMAAPAASGWNYATSGAPPVPTTLPPGGVTQYRSAYRFPPNARALEGTDLVPPGPLPEPPPLPTEAWSGVATAAPAPLAPPPPPPPPPSPSPLPPPPTQWVPSGPPPAAISPPPAPTVATPPPPSIPIQPLTPPPPPPSSTRLWRVVGVFDGDSVTCLDEAGQQQKLNLAGIDAPETSQNQGRASREALAGMVFGRVVEVANADRDSSGTWSGRLFVDGSDVNRQMVATGNAWRDPAVADPALEAAEAEARARRLGLWAEAEGGLR